MTKVQIVEVRIRMYSDNGQGDFKAFPVPCEGEMNVLNALEYVHAHLDPSVSYRSSCRRGVCGGCSMTIDGKVRLACLTDLHDGIEIDSYAVA